MLYDLNCRCPYLDKGMIILWHTTYILACILWCRHTFKMCASNTLINHLAKNTNFCWPNHISPKRIDQFVFWLEIVHLFSKASFDETMHSAYKHSLNPLWWCFWSTENLLNWILPEWVVVTSRKGHLDMGNVLSKLQPSTRTTSFQMKGRWLRSFSGTGSSTSCSAWSALARATPSATSSQTSTSLSRSWETSRKWFMEPWM